MQKIEDIINFLKRTLFPYITIRGAYYMGKENSDVFINCVREDLNVLINYDQAFSTTRHGTTIDAVSIRHLDNISARQFVSYFSYYKSLVPHMSIESQHQIN
ncbi:hypothetical protein M0804_013912 [Polistes exclamans]|nr:hypothetical protein M0804_013912 [Polistes exclamans]